ncbi:MAG: SCO family protein [Planctomycetota bacterium]
MHTLLVILLSLLLTAFSAAQEAKIPAPSEARQLGVAVPDVALHMPDGQEASLALVWAQKPVVLALVFSRCSGICSPFLRSAREAVRGVPGAGLDYTVVAVSIDPDDTPERMAAMAKGLELSNDPGWIFATTDAASIRPLADAVGFDYRWVPERQQFEHPAALIGIKDGRCARILTGGQVTRARLAELVTELRGGFVSVYPGTTNVLFRCFDYDPVRGFEFGWGMLVLVAPTALGLALVLLIFARRRRPDAHLTTTHAP